MIHGLWGSMAGTKRGCSEYCWGSTQIFSTRQIYLLPRCWLLTDHRYPFPCRDAIGQRGITSPGRYALPWQPTASDWQTQWHKCWPPGPKVGTTLQYNPYSKGPCEVSNAGLHFLPQLLPRPYSVPLTFILLRILPNEKFAQESPSQAPCVGNPI